MEDFLDRDEVAFPSKDSDASTFGPLASEPIVHFVDVNASGATLSFGNSLVDMGHDARPHD